MKLLKELMEGVDKKLLDAIKIEVQMDLDAFVVHSKEDFEHWAESVDVALLKGWKKVPKGQEDAYIDAIDEYMMELEDKFEFE